jgi:hypothetical protein
VILGKETSIVARENEFITAFNFLVSGRIAARSFAPGKSADIKKSKKRLSVDRTVMNENWSLS